MQPAAALLLHSNEPASTQSKSSDDTDVGRLIFTLDSPSSPLDCCVYLPTQLVSGRRQTDNERGEGWSLRATTLAPIVYKDGRCLSMRLEGGSLYHRAHY